MQGCVNVSVGLCYLCCLQLAASLIIMAMLKCQLAARRRVIIFVARRYSAGRASRTNCAIHLHYLACPPGHIPLLFISRWTTPRVCCRNETKTNLPPQPSDHHSRGRRRAPASRFRRRLPADRRAKPRRITVGGSSRRWWRTPRPSKLSRHWTIRARARPSHLLPAATTQRSESFHPTVNDIQHIHKDAVGTSNCVLKSQAVSDRERSWWLGDSEGLKSAAWRK